MCTAITYNTEDHYFGRTLDHHMSYGECVTIMPRKYPLKFKSGKAINNHYAMIGMATIIGGYPLYYEATNEKGLSVAALNFPQSASYLPDAEAKELTAPFEVIPRILSSCSDTTEAKALLNASSIVDMPFSEKLPTAPLHWIISDRSIAIVLECTENGMNIYDAPLGILTNEPTFDYHIINISNYMGLSEGIPNCTLSYKHQFKEYSLGMGALGLPGDYSSPSRFVRAAFSKLKSPVYGNEKESVNQFFHILDTVSIPRGSVVTSSGKHHYTMYSCCCNTDKGIYYYKTYDHPRVSAVKMHTYDLDGDEVIPFSLPDPSIT